MIETAELEIAVAYLAHAIYQMNGLTFAPTEVAKETYQKMKQVEPGQLVMELTTFPRAVIKWPGDMQAQGAFLMMSVGILERKVVELMNIPFWVIERDGPMPTETVYYIKKLNGETMRWTNANFVTLPQWGVIGGL